MTSSKEKRMQDKNQIDRKEMYAELLSQIKKNDNFIITTHKSCDPDGMGSELGLDFLLEKLGKKHTILNPDKIIDGLKYYPATGKIVGPLPKFLFRLGSNPSVKNAKFQYELSRLIPSIEIKKK
jgi:hypothetical protein